MRLASPFVITISRLLGCGGAYIGQQLAKQLDIFCADREIICQAAQELSVLDKDIEDRDEKILTFWQSFLQFYASCAPELYVPPPIISLSDHDLIATEAKIIKHIADGRSAVIIGRCGSFVLRDHTNHMSIFLYADIAYRKDRVQKLYNVSAKAAEEMIAQSDKDRAVYCHAVTARNWTDAVQYDLCLNTGKVELDKCVELILRFLE